LRDGGLILVLLDTGIGPSELTALKMQYKAAQVFEGPMAVCDEVLPAGRAFLVSAERLCYPGAI
jgi:hypothetical protein